MKVFIARHGDAAHSIAGGERELTSKGLQDALALGKLMSAQRPQQLLYSPKRRTEQSAHQIQTNNPDLPMAPTAALLPSATPVDIVDVLDALVDCERVLLVSHLPLVAQVVGWLLSGDSSDYPLPGFPAAGVVALDMGYVGRGQAQLEWFAFPPHYRQRRH